MYVYGSCDHCVCLYVVVPVATRSDSMFDWLALRSGENPLTIDEQAVLYSRFPWMIQLVEGKLLSIKESRLLVRQVKNALRSQTTAALFRNGFFFYGLLRQTGGGKALLYNVIEVATGEVKCGKVYSTDLDSEATVNVEIEGSSEVHKDGPNQYIVCYQTIFRFKHESNPSKEMIALIMPLYQLSLAALLDAFFDQPLPKNMFLKVATCLLSAGSRFHELNKGHCDLKPENIMIAGGYFTVIDLGAVCNYNVPATEYTPGYCLDAPLHLVTPIFDLNCSAVTLARCCISDFQVIQGRTRAKLLQETEALVSLGTLDNLYTSVLKICLTASDCSAALAQLLAVVS